MDVRQFFRLADVQPSRRLELLAVGLQHVHDHIVSLEAARQLLADEGPGRASALLGTIATEEVGKFLILLDAARMNQHDQAGLRRQLQRAGDHLAKLIYAEAHSGSPATYGEVVGFIDSQRVSLYLDGPRDFDWVFRNELLAGRERLLYVDLINGENGLEWSTPEVYDKFGLEGRPQGLPLVRSLQRAGVTTVAALATLEQQWADFKAVADTHYQELTPRIRASLVAVAEANDALIDP